MINTNKYNKYQFSLKCKNEICIISMDRFFSDLTDASKKLRYRQKATEYMDRAELLTKQIEAEKASGNFHEQIK